MERETLRAALSGIFSDVFEQPGIVARDDLTAKDVEGWDSVSHIDMVCAVEDKLGITFTTADIARLANVGELLDVISRKLGGTEAVPAK